MKPALDDDYLGSLYIIDNYLKILNMLPIHKFVQEVIHTNNDSSAAILYLNEQNLALKRFHMKGQCSWYWEDI